MQEPSHIMIQNNLAAQNTHALQSSRTVDEMYEKMTIIWSNVLGGKHKWKPS